MENLEMPRKIVLKSVYKVPKVKIQPTKDRFTGRYLGIPELSDDDKKKLPFVANKTDIVELFDGRVFDLSNKQDAAIWEWVKYSPKVAESREDADRKPAAEFYVFEEGIEAAKKVSRRELKIEAYNFIKNDSDTNLYRRARLLGNKMNSMSPVEVKEYLYSVAEDNPSKIISVYKDGEMQVRLLLIEAMDKNPPIIRLDNGVYRYGEKDILGTTEDQAVAWLQSPDNSAVTELIKKETYPQYYKEEKTTSKKTTSKTSK